MNMIIERERPLGGWEQVCEMMTGCEFCDGCLLEVKDALRSMSYREGHFRIRDDAGKTIRAFRLADPS